MSSCEISQSLTYWIFYICTLSNADLANIAFKLCHMETYKVNDLVHQLDQKLLCPMFVVIFAFRASKLKMFRNQPETYFFGLNLSWNHFYYYQHLKGTSLFFLKLDSEILEIKTEYKFGLILEGKYYNSALARAFPQL